MTAVASLYHYDPHQGCRLKISRAEHSDQHIILKHHHGRKLAKWSNFDNLNRNFYRFIIIVAYHSICLL